jgi:peroxiredoxin
MLRFRLVALFLVGLGSVLLMAAVALVYSNRPAVGFPRVGSRMADFTLNDLNGKKVNLSDYAGKTVLINAWASWCPPCLEEMPMLVREYTERQGNGFVILAINAGETQEEAAAFATKMGLEFPVLLDPDSALLDSFLIDSLPTSVLIGPDGIVKAVHIGLLSPEQFTAKFSPQIP